MKKHSIINFSIILEFVWLPLTLSIFPYDGAGRIPFFLLITSLFLSKSTHYFKIPLVKTYSLWVFYAFFNTVFIASDAYDTNFILFASISKPLLVLILVLYSAKKDINALLNTLIIGLYIFCLLGLLSDVDFSNRLSGGVVNSNSIGTRCAFIIFFIFLQYINSNYTVIKSILVSVLPLILILFTQSRTSFGLLIIFIIFFIIYVGNRSNIKSILSMIIILFILIIGIVYVMNKTDLGERIIATSTQVENTARETGTILDYMGDRGFQYYESWYIFLDYKLNGVGLGNYVNYSQYPFVLHSDYLIHFLELGVVGFILYLTFQILVFKRLLLLNKKNKRFFKFLLGGLVALYFISFVTRVSYYSFYFSVYGLIIYFTSKDIKNIESK